MSIWVVIFSPRKRLFLNFNYETRAKFITIGEIGFDDGGGSKLAPFGAAN
jgi:hypothetical protein